MVVIFAVSMYGFQVLFTPLRKAK